MTSRPKSLLRPYADRPDYPISILNDTAAAKYIDGSAFHLYGGTIDALTKVHEVHPAKHLYFTEQWVGAPGDFAGDFTWHTENLIIGAPRNWARTVLEWNLAADENQDPHTDREGVTVAWGQFQLLGILSHGTLPTILWGRLPGLFLQVLSELHLTFHRVLLTSPTGLQREKW